MAKVFIETPRLLLREIIAQDAERIFLMDSNVEVMQYLGVKPVTTLEESEQTIKKIRKQYQENGIGRWAVIEKESNLLIGWSGLKVLTEPVNGYKDIYEIGYRFLPESWGKGYATESGRAVLDYGFNQMKLDIIYAYADIENADSCKILKDKFGFEVQETFVDPLDNATCAWFELTKEKYSNN